MQTISQFNSILDLYGTVCRALQSPSSVYLSVSVNCPLFWRINVYYSKHDRKAYTLEPLLEFVSVISNM